MPKTRLMDEDWDYLIILDACRYDYFEQTFQSYLDGRLEKKLSVGSSTREWRLKNFTEYYPDTIYISSTPFINSIALSVSLSGRMVPLEGSHSSCHISYTLWKDFLPQKPWTGAIEFINGVEEM